MWKELQSGGESEKTPEGPHRRDATVAAGLEGAAVVITIVDSVQISQISTLRL